MHFSNNAQFHSSISLKLSEVAESLNLHHLKQKNIPENSKWPIKNSWNLPTELKLIDCLTTIINWEMLWDVEANFATNN